MLAIRKRDKKNSGKHNKERKLVVFHVHSTQQRQKKR